MTVSSSREPIRAPAPRRAHLPAGRLVAIAAMALALVACGEPDPTPTPAGPGSPSAQASSTPPASATDEPTDSRTLHVATDGDDANPGTEDEPLRTISVALQALRPGETLLVRGGTYEENITEPPIASGTPDEPITVAAYPGEQPVIRGLLWLVEANHWTVDGIDVTWHPDNRPTDHMVKFTDGVGWTMRNAEVWGAESYANVLVAGTQPNEPDDWSLVGNCIHSTRGTNQRNQDHNLYVNTGLEAGEGLIEGNIFFDAANGQNIKLGGPASAPDDGSVNVTVRYNTMEHAAQSILLAGGTANVTIERNIVGGSFAPWLVRGFRLTGENNVLRDNIGYDAEEWIRNDEGYVGVTDGGGNRFADPQIGDFSCDGFRPKNPDVEDYGRWASDLDTDS